MTHFTQTSDAPYDSCEYVLHYSDGRKQVWEDYEELRDFWYYNRGEGMSVVEVLSKKPKKKRAKAAGF